MPLRASSERSRINCSGEAYNGIVTVWAPGFVLGGSAVVGTSGQLALDPTGHDGLGDRRVRSSGSFTAPSAPVIVMIVG